MIKSLNFNDNIWAFKICPEVLGGAKVEEAKATIETDGVNILNVVEVESNCGGCNAFDNEVNELIQNWTKGSLMEAAMRI